MQLTWLLERDVFEENLERLQAEILRQDMSFKEIRYVPFEGGTYDLFPDGSPVISYGSLNLLRQLIRQYGRKWSPVGYCSLPNFECTKYYAYFGKYLLNDRYMMMPLSEVMRQKDFIYDTLGVDGSIFIRPSSGFKLFTGCVLPKKELTLDELGFGYYHEDEAIMTVVASPKPIESEWRIVIADKKVIAGGRYKLNGEAGEMYQTSTIPGAVKKYAEEIAQTEWEPDPVYVIDVCDSNGRLYLLEINSFSSSGLYELPIEPIVKTVSQIAMRDWRDIYGCREDAD